MNILIIINAVLIVLVIVLLAVRQPAKKDSYAAIEDLELIEFQQNMHNLIDELNKVSDSKIKEMDAKIGEMNTVLKAVDSKMRELKYVIERNRYMREADFKTEVSQPVKEITQESQKELHFKRPLPSADVSENPLKGKSGKFTINETNDYESSAPAGGEDKYEYISKLADSGMAASEISRVTGINVGEIELIRNIKKR